MRAVSGVSAFGLLVAALHAPEPLAAQASCPRASGADAEAGWTAYGSNDMGEARSRFEDALTTCPDDQYARTGLGYVALREGDAGGAESAFGTVVAVQPDNVDALAGLGLLAWRAGDLGAVESWFGRVVQLVPDHPTAREYLDRISGRGPDPETMDAADEAWASGNTAAALELYRARLATTPEDDVAALRVGLIRAWQGAYDESLQLLNGLIGREPGHLDARLARARVLAWSGDLSDAQAEARDILEVDPDNAEALEALALFQSWAGDADEALASYDELLTISPQSGSAGRQRAQALAWASRYEASRTAYEALLARDPEDVEARLGLARTLAYAQDFDASIVEYDRVLSSEPGHTGALVGKARTLGWSGRLVEAERVAVGAVAGDRNSAAAWAGLGELYRWQGRTAASKTALETAARLAPTDADVLDQLRSVNQALAPSTRPRVVYEDDSDGNRMVTTRLEAGWHPVPRLEVRAEGYYKDLEQGFFKRNAAGGSVLGTYQVEPGWRLSAGVGGSRTNGMGDPFLLEYRARVTTPDRQRFVGGVGVTSMGLNETAVLAEIGARATEVLVTGRWTPTLEWRVDGSLGAGRYEGSEPNGRRSASLSTSRRVGRIFSVGASFRGFSFEKDLDDGYFDPDFYGIVELTSYLLHRPGRWTLLVEAAPGVQQVRADGDWGPTVRANARVAYGFGPGREISLAFGYSSAGLLSFASTAEDYRYTTFVLGSSWIF